MDFIFNSLAAAITGVLTGFGVGGGTLLILYMQTFTAFSQASAQGINLAYFLPTAGASLIGHIKEGRIVWRAVILSGGAGLILGILSARFAGGLDDGILR